MASFVSPGVFINVIDLSQYAARISTSILAMIGGATKGPIDERRLITNERQFIQTFGRPVASPDTTYGHYAAIQYLRQGNQLQFVRVAGVSAAKAAASIDDATTGAPLTLDVEALSEGDWANYAASATSLSGAVGLRIIISDATIPGRFKLEVEEDGVIQESYDDLLIGAPNTSDSDYVETRINGISTRITVDDDPASDFNPVNGTHDLTGGLNGISDITDADIVGTVTGTARTGLKIFEDTESLDINLLAVPGFTSAAVHVSMIATAEQRGDTFAILDPPIGLDASGIIDFHNGTGAFSARVSLNSNVAGIWWAWVEMFDAFNNVNVFTPPSGWVAGQMAFTDRVADPWFAPAGFNRGILRESLALEYSPTFGERETMYGNGNAVNPLVEFVPEGVTIFGQRTLQRSASALDRVNVSRLVLFAKKVVATTVRVLQFEQNDEATQNRFVNLVEPIFDNIKARRGVIDFQVICDDSTNPPEVVEQNVLKGIILIKPTKTAEIIEIDFTLLPQGAEFSEFLASA